MTSRQHRLLKGYEHMTARPGFLMLLAVWHTFFLVACANELFVPR